MANKKLDSDVEFIKALSELLRDNDLTEIEVRREYGENDSMDVRVGRTVQTIAVAAPAPIAAAPVAVAAAPAATAAPAPAEDPASHPGAVTSPMVGTIYLSSEPSKPAFVSVGDKVSEGDTILIIEAMKTMNQIPAPTSGTVKRILVEDSGAAEFGTLLMIIE